MLISAYPGLIKSKTQKLALERIPDKINVNVLESYTNEYGRALLLVLTCRTLFMIEQGHLGLGSDHLQKGDLTATLLGASVRFLFFEI